MSNRPATGRGKPRRNTDQSGNAAQAGVAARRVAIKALVRIEQDEAYANLVLGPMLERSQLSDRDRGFVTELVYGTTRMQRACDFLVERYMLTKADHQVRAALRLGAYQLRFLDTAPHAAVSATVGAVRGPGRGVVNAVLRKLAVEAERGTFPDWPNEATRLSYPTWIVKKLEQDLGANEAVEALQAMNVAASVSRRADGYVQDMASQLVTEVVGAKAGQTVVDLCAAPGGKATAMAANGAFVVAGDIKPHRARLIDENTKTLGSSVAVLVGDGLRPPLQDACADLVLVDAPCSGLGSLRRRADARWRIDAQAPARLGALQCELVQSALRLLRPGGVLTYSVCTLTDEEGPEVLDWVLSEHSNIELVPTMSNQDTVPAPWTVSRRVAYLLPDDTDGMMLWQVSKH